MRFSDRTDAGRQLAGPVSALDLRSPVVLALPRGGLPVAYEVAVALDAPLDVLVVRKVGAPGHPEFGIGAIAEAGSIVVDDESVQALGLTTEAFDRLVEAENSELDRRVRHYRGERGLPELAGRDVVLVDDGLATGVTAEAGLRALRRRGPRRLVLAVPVGAPDTTTRLRGIADDVVCIAEPTTFHAVGQFYRRFDQLTDEEVIAVLARAADRTGATP
jgi:putative phosphoribosyl transferase